MKSILFQYFYIFGLNVKFCDGINEWSKNESKLEAWFAKNLTTIDFTILDEP